MRPPALALAAALVGSTLVGLPLGAAQAASPDFRVGWDAATQQFRLVASAGIAPFAEGEELIVSGGDGAVMITVFEGVHTLAAGSWCTFVSGGPGTQVLCVAPTSPPRTRLTIDMRAASVATTTAVAESVSATDPLGITFNGGSGPDYVQGGIADDEIDGGLGDDDLFGGFGNDKIVGGDGADNVDGESGDDVLGGGPGNDYVLGDEGLDSMTGGPGVDELDSEDGMPDTYVNCDNEPGEGAISFDRGLDTPYDCPVVLTPTMPLNVEAAGGTDSITVSWAPSAFDGNSTELIYELFYRLPGKATYEPKPIAIAGSESSYTLPNLKSAGLYWVMMRARNEAGQSPTTDAIPVVVGGAPSPPQSVASVFTRRWAATVSWVPPADTTGVFYELALRVTDKSRKNWLSWQTLPDKVTATSLDVGDDLRIVANRNYQFRVRTVTAKGDASTWINSPVRYAGNLAPLESPTLTGRGPVKVSVTLTGPAWKYNVDLGSLTALMSPTSTQGIAVNFASIKSTSAGDRYSAELPGPLTLVAGCTVGMSYRLPGDPTVRYAVSKVPCPE